MNILLDSHYLVWALQAPHMLKISEKETISNRENNLYFSAISIMELNIKEAKGKLPLAMNLAQFCIKTGFLPLSYTWEHAEATRELPQIHADPFDRMLAAQAKHENLVLMTRDQHLHQYPVTVFNA